MTNEEREHSAGEEMDDAKESYLVAEYMSGLPPISIGALVMPPIWGPARGIWATILWYPLWVFADNCFFAWWSTGTTLATVIGVLTLIVLVVATVAFAIISTPYSALRAIERGKTKEEYQRTEKILAVVGIILGIVFLVFATYYNLNLRAPIVG